MKKLFAVFMAILLILSISVPTFAVEIDNTSASGNAIATYEANSSFKVTIPTYIAPSEKDETASANMYSVTASDVFIPDGNQLTVTVDYDGILTDCNGVEIPYKLFSGGSEVTKGQKIIAKDAGNPDDTATVNFSAAIQAEPRYAGTYTDTVTFNILVEERVFSLEEINADEHLYAIGKTKPEYVVAKFNDGYSEVTVFKNGNESDGEMREWTYSEKSPFTEKKKRLKAAFVNDGVTNISSYAFYGYDAPLLNKITISDSVTSIGDYAFSGCTQLSSIKIPDSVMSIGKSAFSSCTSLESATIGNSVKSIGISAFENCKSLTNLIIPDSVTNMGNYAFAYCFSLERVSIGNGVTYTGDSVFAGCKSLIEIIFSDSVNIIGAEAFASCLSLKSVTIPDSVTSIYAAAFDGCTSLESVTMGNGISIIGEAAFGRCTALTSITIPNSVTEICSGAFRSCTSLQNIIVDSGNSNYCDIDGVLFNKKATNIICCPAGKIGNYKIPDGVTRIEGSAFYGCSSLTDVTIPNSVNLIIYDAFKDCTSLENITIPNSVTKIYGNAFRESGLKTIYGVSGSYAETFAAENGYTFIAQG